MERWIPENSQLWTASHSLGFIDYANGSDEAAILDFDDLDFDHRRRSSPLRPREHRRLTDCPDSHHRRRVRLRDTAKGGEVSRLQQNNGDDYPEAASKHLEDATVLFAGTHADGAAYLAGYVVECALKTLIQAQTGRGNPIP